MKKVHFYIAVSLFKNLLFLKHNAKNVFSPQPQDCYEGGGQGSIFPLNLENPKKNPTMTICLVFYRKISSIYQKKFAVKALINSNYHEVWLIKSCKNCKILTLKFYQICTRGSCPIIMKLAPLQVSKLSQSLVISFNCKVMYLISLIEYLCLGQRFKIPLF